MNIERVAKRRLAVLLAGQIGRAEALRDLEEVAVRARRGRGLRRFGLVGRDLAGSDGADTPVPQLTRASTIPKSSVVV